MFILGPSAATQKQSKNGYWIHDYAPTEDEEEDEEVDPFESTANLQYLRLGQSHRLVSYRPS